MADFYKDSVLLHGPSIYATRPYGDNGEPEIYGKVYGSLSASGGYATGELGAPTMSSGYSATFNHEIKLYLLVEQADGSNEAFLLLDKPQGMSTWPEGYNGGVTKVPISTDKIGSVKLYLDMWSNCSCRIGIPLSDPYGYEYYTYIGSVNTATYNKPSTPSLSVDKSLVDNGTTVTFTYSADTNYEYGTEYLQYSLDKSTINLISANSGSGTFNYTVNPGAGSSITMYCRRYLQELGNNGFSDWSYPGVTVQTKSNYNKPSAPTISTSSTIVELGAEVTFNYTKDNNYLEGTSRIQYSYNQTSWTTVASSNQDAGSFKLNISGSAGTTVKIYCRRVLVEDSLYSDLPYSYCSVNIYTNPTVSGISLSPANIINCNTIMSVTWNAWSGFSGETCYSSVELRSSNTSSSVNIATLSALNSGNSITNVSLLRILSTILESYDNQAIYVKVTRTHTKTLESATGYSQLTVRCRPVSQITNLTNTLGTINENKTISWSYPSGYNGIVSGYDIVLHKNSDGSSTENDKQYTSNTTQFTINVSELELNVYYDISITPYMSYNGKKYSNSYTTKTVSNYLKYIANPGVPVITYPQGGSWPSGNNAYRVVLKLPIDPNVTGSTTDYKYRDVEVTVYTSTTSKIYKISTHGAAFSAKWTSETNNNLKYNKSIIFNLAKVSTTDLSTSNVSIKFRVLSKDGVWSSSSSEVVLSRFTLSSITLRKGDKVLASSAETVSRFCVNISRTADKYYSVTYPSVGDIITLSYFDNLHDGLSEVCNSTSSNDIIVDKSGFRYSLGAYSNYYSDPDEPFDPDNPDDYHPLIKATGYIDYLMKTINELLK